MTGVLEPRFSLCILIAAALALSGCAAPASSPPADPAMPAQWRNAPADSGWVSAEQARAWQQGQWWRLWDDDTLHALIERVPLDNHGLQAAAARVAQAQALLREQRAALWPGLTATLGQQRSGGDERSASGSASLSLNASWSPDLWGRVRHSISAQQASVQISQADLAAARLSAQASLAQAYFGLRAADTEMALMDDIIRGYERAARITQNRYDVGVTARTDTLQAQSTLANARTTRVGLQRSRAVYEHAIALLLGVPPANFHLPEQDWDNHVPSVPADLPALLLMRRPDVAASERAVAAANARIGVSRAAYLPNLSLSASLGAGGARHWGDLVSAPALLWSLGLSLAHNLLDAGARDAQHAQALAAQQAAAASYRQTALAAIKEVEDQLVILSALAGQQQHVSASADMAARIERQMLNRYESGLAAYTEVVATQASALSARRNLLQLQLQRQQAAIALIEALGGGWQAPWADGQGMVQVDAAAAPATPPAPH